MRIVALARAAALAAATFLAASPAHALDGWLDNWNAAISRSSDTGRPLLVVFVQQGCPECDQMESNLERAGARQALRNAVKVILEFSENPRLAHAYQITGTPTTLLLKPGEGRACVFRREGALGSQSIASLGRRVDGLVPKAAGDDTAVAAKPAAEAPESAAPQQQPRAQTAAAQPAAAKRSSAQRRRTTARQAPAPAATPVPAGYGYYGAARNQPAHGYGSYDPGYGWFSQDWSGGSNANRSGSYYR